MLYFIFDSVVGNLRFKGSSAHVGLLFGLVDSRRRQKMFLKLISFEKSPALSLLLLMFMDLRKIPRNSFQIIFVMKIDNC